MLKSLEPISYRSFSITQIIFPSRMFHGMNICHLSSYPVSSKLGSLGPAMWSIFPRITLHFFTVGAYLQVLLQFQSLYAATQSEEKIRRYINSNTDVFRQSEVISSKRQFDFLKILKYINVKFRSPHLCQYFEFALQNFPFCFTFSQLKEANIKRKKIISEKGFYLHTTYSKLTKI